MAALEGGAGPQHGGLGIVGNILGAALQVLQAGVDKGNDLLRPVGDTADVAQNAQGLLIVLAEEGPLGDGDHRDAGLGLEVVRCVGGVGAEDHVRICQYDLLGIVGGLSHGIGPAIGEF